MEDLTQYVQILQGTRSSPDFSRGNTLPLLGRPFGLTYWAPETRPGAWFFHPDDRRLAGLRATHQPSPWIGDYGNLSFLPQAGPLEIDPAARATAFAPGRTLYSPFSFTTELPRYGVSLELVPSRSAAAVRLRFRNSGPRRLLLWSGGQPMRVLAEPSGRLTGWTESNSGGTPAGFRLYFMIECSVPLTGLSAYRGAALESGSWDTTLEGGLWAAEFSEAYGAVIELRIGTSFVSADQAGTNLRRETGSRSLEELREEGREEWNRLLSSVRIETARYPAESRTLYSCLYRAFLFPRQLDEIDEHGSRIHYSPYDGRVHQGGLCTDNGFWDTHRTVYPLLSLLLPRTLGAILDGWTNAFREGGWLPKWASPGYRTCMIATHLDLVLADGITKRIEGFDHAAAFEGMLKDGEEPSPDDGARGRVGLREYLELGWVPSDLVPHAASRTMDFAACDAAIAAAAEALGRRGIAERYRSRSRYYRNVFDAGAGRFRGRRSDGRWDDRGGEYSWGEPFIEGSSWQCGWAVPHDPEGLIELYGGREAFLERFRRLFSDEPRFELGSYGLEIHEMTEMAAAGFGQYAHSNQPVHHIPFLAGFAGRPDAVEPIVRRILTELYDAGDGGFPGDEDNGEMASWYVLGAIGLFQLFPGNPVFQAFPGLFDELELHGEREKPLVIASGGRGGSIVRLDRISVDPLRVPFSRLRQADLLER